MLIQCRRFSFFLLPDFDLKDTFRKAHRAVALRAHETNQNCVVSCSLRFIIIINFFFLIKRSVLMPCLGQTPKSLPIAQRENIVFKLTVTADCGCFPSEACCSGLRRRVSSRSRRVSAGCEEEMQLQPAPSFHEIKYSELLIFKGCPWTE